VKDQPHPFFYIIKQGAVDLSLSYDEKEILVDKCDEGDIVGVRPFFAKDNYLIDAMASEESLLYALPIGVFKSYIFQKPAISKFLLEIFASNTRNPHSKENKTKLISEDIIYNEEGEALRYFKPISYKQKPITANSMVELKEITRMMVKHKIGSVIIEKNCLAISIILF
jgi:CBS domain-containing protein